MSPLRYLTGRTFPTHRSWSQFERGDVESNKHNTTEDWLSPAAMSFSVTLPHHFSHVQVWMCDEINVAQVKRAGEGTARPMAVYWHTYRSLNYVT